MLGEVGAEVTERLYFKAVPSIDEVRALAALVPGGVRGLVSTKSRRYKELGLADQNLTDEEWVALLAREPGIWRRPVAVAGGQAVVGFNAEALKALVQS